MKKLEIGNFHVKDIVFGEKTSYENGILTVNVDEAKEVINPEGKLKNIEFHIVHPGDSVRIMPVKAATEPRYRLDGRCLYPGYTGPVSACGDGKIYAMKGISCLIAGKYSSMGDGIIDMSGPGAEYCHYARMTNIVIYAERTNEKELDLTLREEEEMRLAAHILSEYLGKTLKDQEPEDWEIYELEPGQKEADEKGLPRVALVMTVISQLSNGINEKFYGQDIHNMMPLLVHPNSILDGLVVESMMSGQGLGTCDFCNLPMIKRLYQEHGKTLNFTGVILVPADVSNEMKQRNKIAAGEIGSLLKLDAAIIEEWGGGSNIDVDEFYLLAEFEDRGIKTVGVMTEHIGKMLVDDKADAIVSCGESSTVIELPPMDKVIGDIDSAVRDYYYGCWTTHAEYGPSLREDGSLVINTFAIANGGNSSGWNKRIAREY